MMKLRKVVGGLMLVGAFLPVLLLVRYGKGRLAVVAGILGWFAVLCGVIQLHFMMTLREIYEADEVGLYRGTFFTSSMVVVLRVWVWVVVAMLGGFYAVRKRFSYGRLVMGTLVAGFGIVFLSCPFYVSSLSWLVPVGCVAMVLVLVWLPYQRGQFERLLGFRLSDGDPAPPWPGSRVAVGLSHFGLLVLAVTAGGSAILSCFELVQSKPMAERGRPVWKSPVERNGFEDLEALFVNREERGAPRITAVDVPKSFQQALRFHDPMSSATRAEIYEGLDRTEAETYLGHIGEYIRGFEAASGADYLYIPEGWLNYLNLRTTAYALAARSHLAMLDNRPEDAAADVETLLRTGALISDQPSLAIQLIGEAFRKHGVVAAWNLLGAGADNRALLEELAGMFRECGDVGRRGLNYDARKLGEPGIMMSLVTVVPGFTVVPVKWSSQAHWFALTTWSNFDLVEIGVALERFRLDRGGYPGELAELVPGYLERVPRDPIEGRGYFYERTAEGAYELKNLAPERKLVKDSGIPFISRPLFMPPMLAVDKAADE